MVVKEKLKTDDFPFNTPLTSLLEASPPPQWQCSLFSFHNQAQAVYMTCQVIACFLPMAHLSYLSVLLCVCVFVFLFKRLLALKFYVPPPKLRLSNNTISIMLFFEWVLYHASRPFGFATHKWY